MYQSTDGSGTPRGGVQLSTTGPPTKATVSFGTRRKSSRNTADEMRKKREHQHFIMLKGNQKKEDLVRPEGKKEDKKRKMISTG